MTIENTEFNNQLPDGAVPVDLDGAPVGQAPVLQTGAITFELVNGMTITMAPPKRSLSKVMNKILSDVAYEDAKFAELERLKVKSMLYITHVNGAPIEVNDAIQRYSLEQQIGDQLIDHVFAKWVNTFVVEYSVQDVKN